MWLSLNDWRWTRVAVHVWSIHPVEIAQNPNVFGVRMRENALIEMHIQRVFHMDSVANGRHLIHVVVQLKREKNGVVFIHRARVASPIRLVVGVMMVREREKADVWVAVHDTGILEQTHVSMIGGTSPNVQVNYLSFLYYYFVQFFTIVSIFKMLFN